MSNELFPDVTVEEITLTCTDGMRLAAQRWTSKSSKEEESTPKPVLCLHGFMDCCRSFYFLAPFLVSKFGAQVVALDFPGHGLSSHKSSDHTPLMVFNDMAYYVSEAVHALQWQNSPFTLVGHSMGCAVSIVYTAAFPDQVERLILLDGYAPDPSEPSHIAKIVRQHIVQRRNGNTTTKVPRFYPSVQEAVQTRQKTATNSPGNQWLSEKAAYEMVHRALKAVDGGGFQFRHDPRLLWAPLHLHTIEQIDGFFRDISCRTLWLRAESGWPYPTKLLDRAEAILLPELRVLPGSHHFHADPDTAEQVALTILEALLR
jgi:pimeloyl-ACP methyl ester carboxylesterase